MNRRMKRITLGLLVLLLVGIGSYAIYSVHVLGQESITFARGSIKYYIAIRSRLVRQFPCIAIIGKPEYYYDVGDPNPPVNGVIYDSTASSSGLVAGIEKYLGQHGCTKSEEYVAGPGVRVLIYRRGFGEVRVTLNSSANNRTKVMAFVREFD